MEDKENKPKMLNCMMKGPGPKYALKTLVGYVDHDPSKHRNPAYSMRFRPSRAEYSVGPGPRYKTDNLTNHGPQRSPAFTIGSKPHTRLGQADPGPGAYSPEKCPPMNHNPRPPAYSIQWRYKDRYSDCGPGPSAYILPSCIGPNIPDKLAQGAFSIGTVNKRFRSADGPGPANYGGQNYDLIRRRYPAFSIGSRLKAFEQTPGPGPRYLPRFNTGKNPPMYSFGIKHSECAPPPITECDEDL
ncbi:outer dense fiber protein 3 [Orussus abietinus]|uniref:outer dense fiber protein 3 n=1 Tax=Orussus abietinus TaxID=222816 RepID=UPI000625F253|nr:outer dense fiber protein 3 [Orussus abietinus]